MAQEIKRKRKLVWIAVILVTSIAALGVAGYLALRSPRFHHYLLAQIERRASEATGAEVRVQNFVLHLSRLSADAYGITIRGKERASAHPLVEADQLGIRLKIISLLRKKVDLNEIIMARFITTTPKPHWTPSFTIYNSTLRLSSMEKVTMAIFPI